MTKPNATPGEPPVSEYDPEGAASPDSGIFGFLRGPETAGVVVVPVPFAATASYGAGAESGPDAVLRSSHQMDLFDLDTGRPYEVGVAMDTAGADQVRAWHDEARPLADAVIAAGGQVKGVEPLERALARVNAISGLVDAHVEETVSGWLAQDRRVAVLGGDHSVSFGSIRAHARRWPGLGVLHLDAHADLRDAYEGFTGSHASIMANVLDRIPEVARLVQVGIRDFSELEHRRIAGSGGRVRTFFGLELARRGFEGEPWTRTVARIVEGLPEHVYLSFDIDGLDPAFCPHTGTPVPGGLSLDQVYELVRGVAVSGRTIVGLDLVEVAPGPEGDEYDGNVGARLLYKCIGWMVHTTKAGPAARPG